MCNEISDFEYFRDNQLTFCDFHTGRIDSHAHVGKHGGIRTYNNIGSLNQDGYVRIWCNGTLRMKHRFLYWYYHGIIPDEIDHMDKCRSNNKITNLVACTRSENTIGKTVRTYKHLNPETVHDLCKDIASNQFSITGLANKYGRSRTQIKAIITKKFWSTISDQYF